MKPLKSLLLLTMIAISTTAFADGDAAKFEAYKQRRAARLSYALEARRALNANKGPHVYRTAIAAPVPISLLNVIEAGWVSQPPIYFRPPVVVTYVNPVYPVAPAIYDRDYPSTGNRPVRIAANGAR